MPCSITGDGAEATVFSTVCFGASLVSKGSADASFFSANLAAFFASLLAFLAALRAVRLSSISVDFLSIIGTIIPKSWNTPISKNKTPTTIKIPDTTTVVVNSTLLSATNIKIGLTTNSPILK